MTLMSTIPDQGLWHQPSRPHDGRGAGGRTRELPEGLADPLRRGGGARRRLRRGRQRLPRDARPQGRSWRSRRVPRRSRATTSTSRSRSIASSGWTRSSCPFLSSRPAAGVAAVRPSAVLSRIDEGELVELTRDLIRIPSVVRPGDPDATEAAVAAHVEALAAPRGLRRSRSTRSRPAAPTCSAWLGESGAARRCSSKATPTSSPRAMPPSGATRRSAPTWSTAGSTAAAAADMKSGLAAAMVAAAAIKRSGAPLGGPPRRRRAGRRGRRHDRRQAPVHDAAGARARSPRSSASRSRTSCASSSAAWCGRA